MSTPNMLCSAIGKVTINLKIPLSEAGSGHPLTVGLLTSQHGLEAAVKDEARSSSPEALGLDSCFGHTIVFTGN